jgi:hypothetical protein
MTRKHRGEEGKQSGRSRAGASSLPVLFDFLEEVRSMEYGVPERQGMQVCGWCDDRIEDDPVSYTDPVEVEGVGIVHGYCAEEALEQNAG